LIALMAAIAIVGGDVYTGDGDVQPGATVLVEEQRVVAVGTDVRIPESATRIDASGMIVTPGLIDAHSRIGVHGFMRGAPNVNEAVSGGDDDPIRAALQVADVYNPMSDHVEVARAAGITGAVIVPRGGVVAGQSVFVDLHGATPIRKRSVGLSVDLTPGYSGGSRSRALLRLREVFEDARLYRSNRGAYIGRRLRDLSVSAADLEILERTVSGALPVVFEVDRAAEIRTALRLAREYRLDAVIVGGREAWLVADALAAADVPVLVNPLETLPTGFDSLHSRADNAALLHRAGVRVVLTTRAESTYVPRLRWAAGNAVAAGLPYDAALRAITAEPAAALGLADVGVLRRGSFANLVIWNGDPLDVNSWAELVMIHGEEVRLTTRQDELTERYK